jgi:radical SAM superfamily enzyme YgiQ (UPF0313 family)
MMLNPPFTRPVLRDYYCSTFPKAPYYWQPIDLLGAAALLSDKADILMVDAIASRLTARQTEKIADEYSPQAIFILVSTLTRNYDLELARRLSVPGRRIVVGGEVALDPDFDFDHLDFVHALLPDFTDAKAVHFLAGAEPAGRLRAPGYHPTSPDACQRYTIGLMPHHLLHDGEYRMPLWRGPFYSLLTDFGCPFSCSFCNSGKQALGFKLRDLTEVAEEIKLLKRLGGKKIFIKDMTFGADPNHREAVLSLLAPHGFTLRGYLRADLVSRDVARQLKEAGFELAQIGVERPLLADRDNLRKHIPDRAITRAFQTLRQEGIAAGAHFIVGFEKDGSETVASCVQQARALGAAYCSINTYQHRLGTLPLPAASGWRRRLLSACAGWGMATYNIKRQVSFIRDGHARIRNS